MNKRGYVGIGVFGSKWETNIGTLWRAAYLYDVDFIFTIGKRYTKQPTDTPDTPRHVPLYSYTDWEDFESHLPRGCEVVLIEQTENSYKLPNYHHPKRAVYVLGAEDHGIPQEIIEHFPTVEIPTIRPQSMNVSAAGTLVLYDRHTKGTDLRLDSPETTTKARNRAQAAPQRIQTTQ